MPMPAEEWKPGTIVWAKFERHPYWPGRIASEEITTQLRAYKESQGVGILFFGESLSYALVPADSILEFGKNLRRCKSSDETDDFRAAMEMALSREPFEDPPLVLKRRRTVAVKTVKRQKDKENPANTTDGPIGEEDQPIGVAVDDNGPISTAKLASVAQSANYVSNNKGENADKKRATEKGNMAKDDGMKETKEGMKKGYEHAKEKTKEAAEKMSEKAKEAGSKIREKTEQAVDKTKEAGNKMMNKEPEHPVDKAAGKTSAAAHKTADKTSEVAHKASCKAKDLHGTACNCAEETKQGAKEAGHKASCKAGKMKNETCECTKDKGSCPPKH